MKNVHIDRINLGDAVLHKGRIVTIDGSNLKKNGFMGTSICGDCYRIGTIPVKLITIDDLSKGEQAILSDSKL